MDKNKYIPILKTTTLFSGISTEEISNMLGCLSATISTYKKKEFIIRSGDIIHTVGLILTGTALVIKEDYWGNRTIITELTTGTIFGEAFAALAFSPTESSVIADSDCEVIFFDMKKIMTVCSSACAYHSRLIQNMLTTLARKNVLLTQKIDFMSKKTIREKLLAYLSAQSLKAGSPTFDIPFNRQQLAEFLSVDRSALSNEISKLQNDGILSSTKNHFTLYQK